MRESTNTCAADTWKDKARKCSCHTAVLLLLWTSSQLRTLMLWTAWTLVKASIAYLLNYIAAKVMGNNAHSAKCLKLRRCYLETERVPALLCLYRRSTNE